MHLLNRKYFLLALGIVTLGSVSAENIAEAQHFKGKTIEVIVPAGAGGGLTRNTRRFTKNWSKHIPGNPTVVVKNIVGGGGQKGINFIYKNGRKDGTQILSGPLNLVGINMGIPGIRYDPAKFKIVGTSGGLPYTTIVRTDIKGGIKKREDILSKSKFVTGGRIPGGSLGLYSRMGFEMLGIENRFVIGYKNMPKLKAAMLQNEIQAVTTGNPGYFAFWLNDWLKKGKAKALFYHPAFELQTGKPRTYTHIKGVPSFPEFYRKVKGSDPTGIAWEAYSWFSTYMTYAYWNVMHPDTPNKIVDILRKSWVDNWNDPETLKLFIKGNKARQVLVPGKQAEALAKSFRNMSDGAKRYFAKEFGIGRAAAKAAKARKSKK